MSKILIVTKYITISSAKTFAEKMYRRQRFTDKDDVVGFWSSVLSKAIFNACANTEKLKKTYIRVALYTLYAA